MLSRNIAGCIQERVVVLQLALVRARSWAQLKGREGELVDGFVKIVVGTVDTQIVDRHYGLINRDIVDVNEPKAELVYQSRAEQMGFGKTEKTVSHRLIQRKVKVCRADASTQGRGQSARAKRSDRTEVGKEKAAREFVVPCAEIAVVVCRELIICILPGFTEHECSRAGWACGARQSGK